MQIPITDHFLSSLELFLLSSFLLNKKSKSNCCVFYNSVEF
ncbi:Protein CBG25229 [Caenorhabditis briggsae]|uniref:Protein CBG25229 n=1 Tax=Caenorhabditis briggsae TaxID=6238 RepID=B6IFJ9_CAEBR|nr:Protein CBG25229 [Caenorhabditis briggsae]CAR98679.1 Protein CBG25229 [Caenorhabditis briggsae]